MLVASDDLNDVKMIVRDMTYQPCGQCRYHACCSRRGVTAGENISLVLKFAANFSRFFWAVWNEFKKAQKTKTYTPSNRKLSIDVEHSFANRCKFRYAK